MNVKKPERPSCSNLTERQWKNIVDEIEYEWDLGAVRPRDIVRDILRGISALSCYSLITPIEEQLLKKYNRSCETAFKEEYEKQREKIAGKYVEVSK